MDEIVAQIDWKKFSERVSAGTMVRHLKDPQRAYLEDGDYTCGILIENQPYWAYLDRIGRAASDWQIDLAKKVFEKNPYLRWHSFVERWQDYTYVLHSEYFVDNQWRSYDEIMALP